MSKHTPGEWDVNQFSDLDGDFHVQVVLKSNGCPIAHMYECGGETKANARLIAATPELLDLAECFQAVCARVIEQYGAVHFGVDFAALGGSVNRVIAKATGEQQ